MRADDPATNPTGRQFAISGGGYHAVVTEVGAGLRELGHHAGGTLRPLARRTIAESGGPTSVTVTPPAHRRR